MRKSKYSEEQIAYTLRQAESGVPVYEVFWRHRSWPVTIFARCPMPFQTFSPTRKSWLSTRMPWADRGIKSGTMAIWRFEFGDCMTAAAPWCSLIVVRQSKI